jgi:hypothetical protein
LGGQCDEDHGQEGHGAEGLLRHVVPDDPVDDAQSHGGAEGDRQGLHPGDDGSRQRREEQAAGRHEGVGGDAVAGGVEHGDGGGQHAHEHPHQAGEPAGRHAEEEGPLTVLGDAPHRHARVGAEEEPGQPEQRDGDEGQRQGVVAEEGVGADQHRVLREAGGERHHEGVGVEQVRHQHLHGGEDLQEADRGDGDDEAGGPFEPAQHHIGGQPDHGAEAHGHHDGDGPRPAVLEVTGDGELRGARSHGLVAEVDHPGGAVGEHEADGEQPARGTGDEALRHHPGAEGVGEHHGGQQESGGQGHRDDPRPRRRHDEPPGRINPGPSGIWPRR